ncbi:hypothetical protein GCM10010174_44900 [Kutzneria viridogrisea]|uniref:Uncharacterized protein n=1 Tax=Kutzneria viridogrisea TaxID=47990 RepID=A0ABR6BE73_9PSEU|nr:hypothetical protein [Kutzneria viridogrisea]
MFLRFQSPTPNRRGVYPGIFALVNGLGFAGELTEAEEEFRRVNNAWYDAAYTNPSTVDPAVYRTPLAASWFRMTSTGLVDRIAGYLEILAAHAVAYVRLESTDPGWVLYEDADQVVVVPYAAQR